MREKNSQEDLLGKTVFEALKFFSHDDAERGHYSDEQIKQLIESGEPAPEHVIFCAKCRSALRRWKGMKPESCDVGTPVVSSLKNRIMSEYRKMFLFESPEKKRLKLLEQLDEWSKRCPMEMAVWAPYLTAYADPVGSREIDVISTTEDSIEIDVLALNDFQFDAKTLNAVLHGTVLTVDGLPRQSEHAEAYLTLMRFEELQKIDAGISRFDTGRLIKKLIQSEEDSQFPDEEVLARKGEITETGRNVVFHLDKDFVRLILMRNLVVCALVFGPHPPAPSPFMANPSTHLTPPPPDVIDEA